MALTEMYKEHTECRDKSQGPMANTSFEDLNCFRSGLRKIRGVVPFATVLIISNYGFPLVSQGILEDAVSLGLEQTN